MKGWWLCWQKTTKNNKKKTNVWLQLCYLTMDQSTPPQHNAITTSLLDFVPDKNGVWPGNKGGFKKKKGGKIQDWRTDDPTAVLFRGKSQKKTHNVRLIKTHRTLFFIFFWFLPIRMRPPVISNQTRTFGFILVLKRKQQQKREVLVVHYAVFID